MVKAPADRAARLRELDRRFMQFFVNLHMNKSDYERYARRIRRTYPYLEDLAVICDQNAAMLANPDASIGEPRTTKKKETQHKPRSPTQVV